MLVPSTLLMPCFMLGVIATSLTFDLDGTPEVVASYYTAHRRAVFPANMLVFAVIITGLVPLLRRLAKPTSYDIASIVIVIASLVALLGFVIPQTVRSFVIRS